MTADGRDVVVVAASAGGLQPLRTMLSGLPADLPAAVLVVLHVPSTGGSILPRILARAGPLPAVSARNGEPVERGRVYVAPPDRHLLLIGDTVRLSHGPRQNGVRPAADPLFRSAALHAAPRTTAVVLSGTLDDATLGSATVERRGGCVLVQDPDEAEYDGMPRSALGVTKHGLAVPAAGLAAEVTRLVAAKPGQLPGGPGEADAELAAEISGLITGDLATNTRSRTYSDRSRPDCGGPLYAGSEDRAVTYDCLVGHRWTTESLLAEQSVAVERALWVAIRSLEERGRLTARLADQARRRGHVLSARHFAAAAEEARRSADALREVARGMAAQATPSVEQA